MLMTRVTVFLIFSFIVYFLKYMKDEVKIYDKLDKTIIKKFIISTISTKTYYFKEWTTILHYQQHNKSTMFYYLYMSPLFIQNLSILHYKIFY